MSLATSSLVKKACLTPPVIASLQTSLLTVKLNLTGYSLQVPLLYNDKLINQNNSRETRNKNSP